jgi:Tol biopolymer transport system component
METTGPWMIFSDAAGFWLVNHQGDDVGFMPVSMEYMTTAWKVAPHGGLVAMIQGEQITAKFLKLLSIPSYDIPLTIDLLDYKGTELTFNNEQDARDFVEDRYFAVGQPRWSSNGGKLAFVSSHMGPSPDVYVYDVISNEVTRLTSGPAHAVSIHWSPDDKYIYHAGVEKLWMGYSGSGYSGWTFYSAKADDSGVTTVYQSKVDHGLENILGWYSDHEVLMDSGFWFCGRFDLRKVDIETGKRVSIWPDQYDYIAYNPTGQTALVWVSPDAFSGEDCGPSKGSGLYLVSIPNGRREKLVEFDDAHLISGIEWDERASKFIVDINTIWAMVNMEGIIEMLDEQPIFSPDGKMTALLGHKGKTLRVLDRDGNAIEVEMARTVQHPTWGPDSLRLFFFAESDTKKKYQLYLAEWPDFRPVLITEEPFNRRVGTPTWVMP